MNVGRRSGAARLARDREGVEAMGDALVAVWLVIGTLVKLRRVVGRAVGLQVYVQGFRTSGDDNTIAINVQVTRKARMNE